MNVHNGAIPNYRLLRSIFIYVSVKFDIFFLLRAVLAGVLLTSWLIFTSESYIQSTMPEYKQKYPCTISSFFGFKSRKAYYDNLHA